MKAIVYQKYGPPDVLKLKEVAKPAPKDNEVLIRIFATTVTSADSRLRSLTVPLGFGIVMRLVFGINGPRKKILGQELAGEIESIGKNVKLFNVGEQVFGSSDNMACYAEYVRVPENGAIVSKPLNMTYEEAASVPFGALSALVYLRDFGKIKNGQKVLINGASGCLGTHAVQLAKYFGAEVTGVCSTANLELVKSLGADKTIDYTKENFTKNGETYDIIFDTVDKISFSSSKNSLKQNGRLLLAVAGLPLYFQMLWRSMFGGKTGKKIVAGPANFTKKDLSFIKELIEAGNIKSVIDRQYPLEQIAEAHRYVDKGHKKGNVVINVSK